MSGTVKGGSHAFNPQFASVLGVIACFTKDGTGAQRPQPCSKSASGAEPHGRGEKLTDTKAGASSALRFMDVEKMHLNWTKVHTGPFNRGTKHAGVILTRNSGSMTRTTDPSECSLILEMEEMEDVSYQFIDSQAPNIHPSMAAHNKRKNLYFPFGCWHNVGGGRATLEGEEVLPGSGVLLRNLPKPAQLPGSWLMQPVVCRQLPASQQLPVCFTQTLLGPKAWSRL